MGHYANKYTEKMGAEQEDEEYKNMALTYADALSPNLDHNNINKFMYCQVIKENNKPTCCQVIKRNKKLTYCQVITNIINRLWNPQIPLLRE
eukprot:12293720-Ditylum_brightwellii.AAC.1